MTEVRHLRLTNFEAYKFTPACTAGKQVTSHLRCVRRPCMRVCSWQALVKAAVHKMNPEKLEKGKKKDKVVAVDDTEDGAVIVRW